MAIGVIGGLVTSKLLSLIVIPAAFTRIEDMGEWMSRRLGAVLPIKIPVLPPDLPMTHDSVRSKRLSPRRSLASATAPCSITLCHLRPCSSDLKVCITFAPWLYRTTGFEMMRCLLYNHHSRWSSQALSSAVAKSCRLPANTGIGP